MIKYKSALRAFTPIACGAAMLLALPVTPVLAKPTPEDAARAIHAETLVIDAHADIYVEGAAGGIVDDHRATIDQLRAGNVGAVVFSVFEGVGPLTPEAEAAANKAAHAKLAGIKALAASNADRAEIAYTPADVRRIAASGRTAIIIGFLNAYSLKNDISELTRFHDEGIRLFGLSHLGNTEFADSSRPLPTDTPNQHGGLSPLGRQAISEANRLGLLVDVSQLTDAGAEQAIALSKAPVIASHSNVRALVNNPRNLSDELIRQIAAKGGVVALNAFPAYLHNLSDEDKAGINAIIARYGPPGQLAPEQGKAMLNEIYTKYHSRVTVRNLIDHVDYVVKLVGIDHVALSTDFNHGGGIVGWQNAGDAGNVTAELVKRGYSKADIAKIWSGNFLRVLGAAQASGQTH